LTAGVAGESLGGNRVEAGMGRAGNSGNRRRSLRHALLVAGALAAAVAPARAADLEGRVTTPAGQGAAGARVFIEGVLSGTFADDDGRFRLTGLAPGERTLVIEAFGLARLRQTVQLADTGPATVAVQLAPNRALGEAAARFVPPAPERLEAKRAYLAGLGKPGRPLPDIIIILADDLGWGDLSSYGNRLIRTPNIDALARDGVRMTEFYSASPVCSPSRAALLTGRYPQRSLTANHVFFPDTSPIRGLRAAAGFTNAIMADEILLPEVLQRIGYRTAMAGKWHLGDRAGHLPNDLGFQSVAGVRFSNDMQPLNFYRDDKVAVPAAELRQDALTGMITTAAIAEIERRRDQPLFLYVPFTAPHQPHRVSAARAGRSPGGTYGDVIEELDEAVGRIRAAVEASGRARETLILFTSDNGGDFAGNNGGLRGHKQETHEGGMRVPMIAVWPGQLPRGQVRDGMAMLIDIMPTLLAAGGVAPPADRVIDGRDLLPLWQGKAPSPHDYLFYSSTWSAKIEAVRDARHKYRGSVFNQLYMPFYPGDLGIPITDPPILSDLALDREAHDLSARHPEIRTRLAAEMARFQADLTANPRGWLPAARARSQ
jgi:arylsulfatase A-like enzyme